MKNIISQGPDINEAFDSSTAEAHRYFFAVKEWVQAQEKAIENLLIESAQFGNDALAFRLMLKFIASETAIKDLKEDVYVSLINPVYKETGRLQTRDEHPHGENSLRTKINCLQYFESLNPHFNGRVIVVDDECPENSGAMAESILGEYPNSDHRVYYLGKAIDESDPDIPYGITHKNGSNRSVKGGAALFGMKKALEDPKGSIHIIVDNDADLSVHPMQLGLLVDPIVKGKAKVIAGSRRETDSVSLIGGGRNKRGMLFIKIWQHLLPGLAQNIIDTNRAFKAFDSSALKIIWPSIKIYTFPYQIEVLQASISNNIPLDKVGVAYIDSEAASTQSGDNITETYLNQIHQIIDIASRYDTIPKDDPLLNYFQNISEEKWRSIESNPPENLDELL